jgi:hypothetical protein
MSLRRDFESVRSCGQVIGGAKPWRSRLEGDVQNDGDAIVLLWEAALEAARLMRFPEAVSRLDCTFACFREEEARAFRDRFRSDSKIYRVELVDPDTLVTIGDSRGYLASWPSPRWRCLVLLPEGIDQRRLTCVSGSTKTKSQSLQRGWLGEAGLGCDDSMSELLRPRLCGSSLTT